MQVSLFSNGFQARQDFFLLMYITRAESCFLVDKWAIGVSESRFLTFKNKVSVKPKHKKHELISLLQSRVNMYR